MPRLERLTPKQIHEETERKAEAGSNACPEKPNPS